MGLSLVTGPTLEPISLGEAKDHCKITSTDEDGLFTTYILAARKFAEGYTKRAFLTQTWDYTIDYYWPHTVDWRTQIDLPLPPLQSVTSITYVDANGSPQTLAGSQYVTRTDGPFGRVVPAYGVTWPDIRYQVAAITVRFVAGWVEGSVPDDIRHGLLTLVGHFNEHREAVNEGGMSEVPMTTDTLLSSYRSIRFP